MSGKPRTGVLGGTFDPIHLGHQDVAVAARTALELDRVLLVPSRVPPHRTLGALASGAHRLALVELAAAAAPGLHASDFELSAAGPSYTSLTLERLAPTARDRLQLFFITGADAFAEIAAWHDYPGVLDRSHFIVVSRAGYRASSLPERLPDLASRMRSVPRRSDTAEERGTPTVWLVDAETRDISSSDIRRRLATGHPIDGLVSPTVAEYIERHRLYTSPHVDTALHD